MSRVMPKQAGSPRRPCSRRQPAMSSTSMPGSGSKPSRTPAPVGGGDHRGAAGDQPVPGDLRRRPWPGRTPAQKETASAPRSAPIRTARSQEVDPAGRVVVQQRRGVLVPRVEQVAGAGLDDHAEAERGQPVRHRGDPAGQPGRVRVEVVVVQGERDPVVAEVGETSARRRAGGWRSRWCRSRTGAGPPRRLTARGGVSRAVRGRAAARRVGSARGGRRDGVRGGHVGESFRASRPPSGAATRRPAPSRPAPARAVSAPCNDGQPGDAGADGRPDPTGGGVGGHPACAPPYRAAYQPASRPAARRRATGRHRRHRRGRPVRCGDRGHRPRRSTPAPRRPPGSTGGWGGAGWWRPARPGRCRRGYAGAGRRRPR